MAKSIQAISQHALDRFTQRAGIRFRDTQHAMDKCWDLVRSAKFAGTQGNAAIWMAKGWIMLVNERTVRTMYLQKAVKSKRLMREASNSSADTTEGGRKA